MPVYDRREPDQPAFLDEWSEGFGWIAHPDEGGRRASHAIRDGSDVWLLDPLDAPGVDDRITDLGEVCGVVVCSNWHARDAAVFADRYDVAVHVPRWLSRVADLVDAPIERFEGSIAGFESYKLSPLPGWEEALLYRAADGTLYSPDVLSRWNAVEDERIGLTLPMRPFPPRGVVAGLEPARILSGHGRGIELAAATALQVALDGARVRLPEALRAQTLMLTEGVYQAVRD